ncbi:MAG: preprotein translocase subunit SecG [Parcubacteria group bacterium RIFCSPHIGHO2_01_FULL_47_10b]|nr:MAG: preprotein translocase subunit SecG [Parcubacteria group bacterium RIFCSPHIGHO2_01_FULL_47_10b]
MNEVLMYLQIILAVILAATILLQQRSSSLGGAFGGMGETFHTKRGAEQFLHLSTIALVAGLLTVTLLRAIL